METIISFQHATLAYDKQVVLKDINLSFHKGQFAGIVGPSGSGKTTLLRSILGLITIVHGDVFVSGGSVKNTLPSAISYVPQLENIDFSFPATVEQVVAMGLFRSSSFTPWLSEDEKEKVKTALQQLDITTLKDRHIRELSGGQQQRVYIARSLVSKPTMLLLDEPTTGIDVKTRHMLLHLLNDLHDHGMTIILTTHDLNAVAAHLPWLVCFNKKLIAEGTPKEVFTSDILSKTYNAPLQIIKHTGVVGEL